MYVPMAYRGIETEEFVPGLGAVDYSKVVTAGAQLVGSYLQSQAGVDAAKAAAAAAKANAQAAQVNAAARNESAKRLMIAGVVVGGAILLAAVVIAATRKG